MSEWTYLHRAGHIRAKVVEEHAEAVVIEYAHVRDKDWRGMVELEKAEFAASYAPSP